MADLSGFPITKRWPAQRPHHLQLYSLPTANGVKVSIMLEEIGLPYEPHTIDTSKNETWTPEFLSLNPDGKIPAILDPDGPDGQPLALSESGAILLYLAEKTGKLIPGDPARRIETIQWVFFQMASVGPMFAQSASSISSPDIAPATSSQTSQLVWPRSKPSAARPISRNRTCAASSIVRSTTTLAPATAVVMPGAASRRAPTTSPSI